MTPSYFAAYNVSRRKHVAPMAICLLCRRPFERLPQYEDHCSQACRRLDKQRKSREWTKRYPQERGLDL